MQRTRHSKILRCLTSKLIIKVSGLLCLSTECALKNYFCLLFIKAIEARELDERLQEIENHIMLK